MTRSVLSSLGASALAQVREQLTPKEIAADKPTKYRAQRCEAWGIKFASLRERQRFGELRLLERAGKITDLEAHPRYSLDLNGAHIGFYTGDSRYREIGKGDTIEDVKGGKATHNTASRLRIKVFEAIYRVKVKIIT